MANSNGWGDGAANNAIGWGQGANNAIGWGKSHTTSWAGATDIVGLTTDADAQAFITAAAITDPTQQTAINNLVVGMKADGVWTKMKAIYPFVGGTATTHKYNLKDPRDLDAAFRLVFNGGWTHSSTGATPNGTNGYADTKLIPSSVLSQNSTHISSYIRNTSQGVLLGTDNLFRLWIAPNFNGTQKYVEINSGITTTPSTTISTATGLWLGSRIVSSESKLYNSSSLNYTAVRASSGLDNLSMFISARNTITPSNYSSSQVAFSSLGDGLTDTEAANLYTRVQAFQTSLSRQV
jgi:hypothetical protein